MRRISLDLRLFILFEVLILCLGAFLSWYFALTVFDKEKTALLLRVKNAASVIDSSLIAELKGNETDLEKPVYTYLKSKMVELKAVNTDARFVYLMGYRSDINKQFFFVDSESPQDKESYSPPGQIYAESSDLEIANFLKGVAFAEGPYQDSWGRWVSAYAPIFASDTGLPLAVIGIDIDASEMIMDSIYAGLLPALLTIFIILLFYAFHRMKKRESESTLNDVKMEFTSFMSHEIRGFVTKMKSSTRTLEAEEIGALTDEQKAFVHEMSIAADDFGNLIQEFLDIGRIERDNEISLVVADCNLLDIIKGVAGDMRDSLDAKGVSIVYEGNMPEKAYSSCDSDKIARVFSNIIGNAIKYSSQKMSIRIGYLDANTHHTFYIKDDGIGIPESDKTQMFNKFFRASNARAIHSSGTGLGLYFSKLIVDRHKGRIWFESGEGRGTTFFVSLPKI